MGYAERAAPSTILLGVPMRFVGVQSALDVPALLLLSLLVPLSDVVDDDVSDLVSDVDDDVSVGFAAAPGPPPPSRKSVTYHPPPLSLSLIHI